MEKDEFIKLKNLIYDQINHPTIKTSEEMKDSPEISLESYKNYYERQVAQMHTATQNLTDFVNVGFQKILQYFSSTNDQKAQEAIQQGTLRAIQLFANSKDVFTDIFSPDRPVAEIFKYNQELLEKIYQAGISYYKQNKLADASHVLALLNILDPTHFSSWLSLGVVLEQEKKWEESLEALKVACQLDKNNPLPHLHEAICYHFLNKKQEAKSEFDLATSLANASPQYAGVKDEIKNTKQAQGY